MQVRLQLAERDGPTAPPHFPREAVAAPGEPVSLGSAAAATLCVPDDPALAPRHTLVVCYADGCRVFDASGRGLVVHGAAAHEAVLRDGSVVRAGDTVVRVAVLPPNVPPDGVVADGATAETEPLAVDRAAAFEHLRAVAAPLYAVVDGAQRGAAVAVARASGELLAPLPDDAEALGYEDGAPWLVRLPPESPLLKLLLRVGWGTAECMFLESDRPFAEVRAFLRGLFFYGPAYTPPVTWRPIKEEERDPETNTFFRFYDPAVLSALFWTPGVDVRPFFGRGTVSAWHCEVYDDPETDGTIEVGGRSAFGPGRADLWIDPKDPDAWADDAADDADLPPPRAFVEFRAPAEPLPMLAAWTTW